MTLRRRLQIFVAFFAATVIAAAVWERYVYLRARAEISDTVAQDIRLDEVADQLSLALSVSIFVSLLLLVLAWIYLERWVLAPLDEMRTELRMVASGTIHQVIEVANPPEIQLAAADAESMRQNLVNQIDLARAAWQGLEQNAPLVASMRKALSPTLIDTEKFGLDVAAAVETPTLWATQFHPEKSGRVGLELLQNFVAVSQS